MLLDVLKLIVTSHPNLTVRQLTALVIMRDTPHVKARELAAAMKVNRSVVTRLWDSLSIWGLVKRVRGEDARDVHGNLTDNGLRIANQLKGL